MKIEYFKLSDAPNLISDKKHLEQTIYFYHDGGDLNKEIKLVLSRPESKIAFKGSIVGSKKDQITLKVILDHKHSLTTGRVHVKSYLSDNCIFTFQGLILINNGAHKSDSFLQQDNLVSSGLVTCNTDPQLEILANDVKASHGATIKYFSMDDLYYFNARGVSDRIAKKALARGFLTSVYQPNEVDALNRLKIKI